MVYITYIYYSGYTMQIQLIRN